VLTVAAARSEQHGGAKGAAIPLRLSVVVGMISAHTVRHPSLGKHCDHSLIREMPRTVRPLVFQI